MYNDTSMDATGILPAVQQLLFTQFQMSLQQHGGMSYNRSQAHLQLQLAAT
jgi:hypothetical protein